MRAIVIAAVLVLLGSSLVSGQTPVINGALARGDLTLRSGELYDEHDFEGRAGQQVVFELTSSVFDPYLIVIAPSGDRKENDDWEGSNRRSRIELTLTETGRYRVVTTSYEKGETGNYELRINAIGGTAASSPGMRVEAGRLASGDRTLTSGEYYDEFTFQGRRGEPVTIDLRSDDLDPYLIVIGPDNQRQENDDYEGDSRRSLVSFDLPEDGTYRVLVTSYKPKETGGYDLRIQQPQAAGAARAGAGSRIERGQLDASDRTLDSGEYMDTYTFEGRPGQRVTLDLASRDFDTYLILVPPKGSQQENDDIDDESGHSRIEADLTEVGTHRVIVTSYRKGELGSYELHIDLASAPGGDGRSRDLVSIGYGDARTGTLDDTDARISSGEYRDLYSFDGRAGEQVVVELSSSDFDPYLVLTPPSGDSIDNDDADNRVDLSRIELTLPVDGRYRVMVTSYQAGETGAYRLTVREDRRQPVTPPSTSVRSGSGTPTQGRTFGLFVGISDYGGRASDLLFTADDARRMEQAMLASGMRPADSTLLIDGQATRERVRRAIANVASQAGPNDTFVLFYSGHGGREPRSTVQLAEADGQDETLVFYDADATDDEIAEWLSGVRTRFSLIVLDSCFSGGFQKDLITAPYNRMGLFSSEEDVLSSIATKFRAGGYLSHFIAEAIADRRGDLDGNGEITAIELSQYLRDRYRSDVKSGSGGDDYVRVGGPQTGYQHLVVDRGGIRPYDVLFRLR